MSSEHQSHFIARRLEDHKKATQRLLHCHLCSTPIQFRGEKEFLEHVQHHHSEHAADAPDGSTWKTTVQQAAEKARQRRTRRVPVEQPSLSRQSSGDSMKLNYGDYTDGRSASASSRPVSAIVNRSPEPRIDDFNRLSLDQSSTPGLIPLKRSAVHNPNENRNRGNYGSSPKTRRSRGPSGSHDSEFDRGKIPPSKKLFDPNTDNATFGKTTSSHSARPNQRGPTRPTHDTGHRDHSHHHYQHPHRSSAPIHTHSTSGLQMIPVHVDESAATDEWDEEEPELLLQPETRPISHEQLVHEVKGIYAGLVMVENKCMDVDEKQLKIAQDPETKTPLTQDQWSALIALHKTLLHEHHDFFLASQHPSATPGLSNLAGKYDMPARMWKHGIHAFLEVLRLNLPESFDFMLTFLNISYSMMALLYETVPMFEDTWMECLGDLGRYRMTMPDNDQRDRDIWADVARLWYGRAANKRPGTGHLLHHLGILAKPSSVSQLSLYCRALNAIRPFEATKGSIMAMFRPIMADQLSKQFRQNSMDTLMIKCLGVLFTGRSTSEFSKYCEQIVDQGMLSKYCDRAGSKFKEIGVAIAVSVICGLLEFGASRPDGTSRSIIRRALDNMRRERLPSTTIASSTTSQSGSTTANQELTNHEKEMSENSIIHASRIAFGTFGVALGKQQDRNVIPMIHTFTAFLKFVAPDEKIMEQIEMNIPWTPLVAYLNHFANPGTVTTVVLSPDFPKPADDAIGRPLPEDFIMRGQISFFDYFPRTWFSDADIDDEEKLLELPSMAAPRLARILWNGMRIASHKKWIIYDTATFQFSETEYAKALKPRELPSSFEPGILPGDLEELVPPPPDGNFVPATPTLSEKSGSIDLAIAETTGSPRQSFTMTPKILQRASRTGTDSQTGASPTKNVIVEEPDQVEADRLIHRDDT